MTVPKRFFESLDLAPRQKAALTSSLVPSSLADEAKERVREQLLHAMSASAGVGAGAAVTKHAVWVKGVLVSVVATTALVGSAVVLTLEPWDPANGAAVNQNAELSRRPAEPLPVLTATREVVMVPESPPALVPRPTARASAKPTGSSLAAEASLLERARNAVARHPADALALIREFDRRFAHPQLRAERDLIENQALTALGRPPKTVNRNGIYRDQLR